MRVFASVCVCVFVSQAFSFLAFLQLPPLPLTFLQRVVCGMGAWCRTAANINVSVYWYAPARSTFCPCVCVSVAVSLSVCVRFIYIYLASCP